MCWHWNSMVSVVVSIIVFYKVWSVVYFLVTVILCSICMCSTHTTHCVVCTCSTSCAMVSHIYYTTVCDGVPPEAVIWAQGEGQSGPSSHSASHSHWTLYIWNLTLYIQSQSQSIDVYSVYYTHTTWPKTRTIWPKAISYASWSVELRRIEIDLERGRSGEAKRWNVKSEGEKDC